MKCPGYAFTRQKTQYLGVLIIMNIIIIIILLLFLLLTFIILFFQVKPGVMCVAEPGKKKKSCMVFGWFLQDIRAPPGALISNFFAK